MSHKKQHTLIHLNDSGCEIDNQTFKSWARLEQYIDDSVLPFWQDGDTIVCDGEVREVFSRHDWFDPELQSQAY